MHATLKNEAIENEPIYKAESAYHLRAFAKAKRYQMNDITAYTVAQHSSCRHEVEDFIKAVFKQSYGANITQFFPELVALRDQQGVLMAAFGLRNAAKNTLFLEQYLDVPIEQLMSSTLNRNITREQISCIGNLAVANPRNASVLIAHIIQYSLDMGIEWCVATTHHSLQNGLIKGGRDVYPLMIADPKKLPAEEMNQWGRYYHHLPQVVAIRGTALPL